MNARFEHKTIMDGRYHVITSPDESGVYAAATSEAEARRKAEAILEIIRHDRDLGLGLGVQTPGQSFKTFG